MSQSTFTVGNNERSVERQNNILFVLVSLWKFVTVTIL